MSDSTTLGVVVDQSPARTTQLVVEADAGGEAQEALQYALFEAVHGAGSMPFQCEDILAGSKMDSMRLRSGAR